MCASSLTPKIARWPTSPVGPGFYTTPWDVAVAYLREELARADLDAVHVEALPLRREFALPEVEDERAKRLRATVGAAVSHARRRRDHATRFQAWAAGIASTHSVA